MAAIMDVDENLKQTYIQYDPAPRKGNEVQKKRVPDYFLWIIILHSKLSLFAIIIFVVILLKISTLCQPIYRLFAPQKIVWDFRQKEWEIIDCMLLLMKLKTIASKQSLM